MPRQIVRDFGTCLFFNGTDSRINLGTSSLGNPSAQITISVWVKPIATGNPLLIVSRDDTNTQRNYQFQIKANNGIEWDLWDSGSSLHQLTTAANTIDTSGFKWQHIVVTYDGTNQYIYLNGVQLAISGSFSNALKQNTYNTYIGCLFSNSVSFSNFFKNLMDEVRIYSIALTGTQVTNLYYGIEPPTTNLNLWYKFNEGSGTSATDSSGNGITGTINTATYSTDVFMKARTIAT